MDDSNKISELVRSLNQAEKAKDHLKTLEKRLQEALRIKESYADLLTQAHDNIEDMEKLSMKGLFHKVLGDKEKQLEKGRQEFLQASLKLSEAKKTIELFEFEKNILDKKVSSIGVMKNQLKKLLELREKKILNSNHPLSSKVSSIYHEIDANELKIKEINEAIFVGKEAHEALRKMNGYLHKAKQWGDWDLMGGSSRTGYYKHDFIDRAKDQSFQVKHFLTRFEDELKDVFSKKTYDFTLHIANFSRFTDIFFDNLISDWIIQKRIKNTITNTESVIDKVLRLLQNLDNILDQTNTAKTNLEIHKKEILLSLDS